MGPVLLPMVAVARARHALAVTAASPMSASPVMVGPYGGTIYQLQASQGQLFQVCFEGQCLFCESLHVGMAHLNRMERIAVSAHTAKTAS